MSQSISRRSLAKGAAWAAPVTVATAAIPAYAASNNRKYELSGSWLAHYQNFSNSWSGCGWSAGQLTTFEFYTWRSILGAAPGFGVYELDGSPQTGVTLNGLKLRVAFPAGLVYRMQVTGGSYQVSGPQRSSSGNNDIFTFTFTGQKRYRTFTNERESTWPGSPLNTQIDFNRSKCYPLDLGSYYISFEGSFTTDNGFTRNFADFGWLKTSYQK